MKNLRFMVYVLGFRRNRIGNVAIGAVGGWCFLGEALRRISPKPFSPTGSLLLLVVIGLLTGCATPEEQAMGRVMETAAPMATQTAVALESELRGTQNAIAAQAQATQSAMMIDQQRADQQRYELEANAKNSAALERQDMGKKLVTAIGWVTIAFVVGGGAAMTILVMSTATSQAVTVSKASRLPGCRDIGNGLRLLENPGGVPLLLDVITGTACPINDAVRIGEAGRIRAEYRRSLEMVRMAGGRLESIAKSSKSDMPAEWLAGVITASSTAIEVRDDGSVLFDHLSGLERARSGLDANYEEMA